VNESRLWRSISLKLNDKNEKKRGFFGGQRKINRNMVLVCVKENGARAQDSRSENRNVA